MAGYRQQDAHEFYQYLVDKLHGTDDEHVDEYDKPCQCFFHRAFHGKLRSTVTCDKCGNTTETEDPMIDLSLDVQVQAKKRAMGGVIGPSSTATLKGCLESFTSPEHLLADAYNCGQCGGTPQKATKQLQIKKLPAILCLQLKVRQLPIPLSPLIFQLADSRHSAMSTRLLSLKKSKDGLISLFH